MAFIAVLPLSGASRAGTFRTDAAGNSSSVALNDTETHYVKATTKLLKGYALVDEVKTVTVKSGQGKRTVTFSRPAADENPCGAFVKENRYGHRKMLDPSGTAAYQGAQFLVKF